jgi:hypothetical protein
MRKLILATAAVFILGAPLATLAQAEEVIIKKDDSDRRVIKREVDRPMVREPEVEKKVIIKRD